MTTKPQSDTAKPVKKIKRIYCRYCGAKLRRDRIGQYCHTRNCLSVALQTRVQELERELNTAQARIAELENKYEQRGLSLQDCEAKNAELRAAELSRLKI